MSAFAVSVFSLHSVCGPSLSSPSALTTTRGVCPALNRPLETYVGTRRLCPITVKKKECVIVAQIAEDSAEANELWLL